MADQTLPALLLPLRLETRFFHDENGAPKLKVRIFPDDIHLDVPPKGKSGPTRAAGLPRTFVAIAYRNGKEIKRGQATRLSGNDDIQITMGPPTSPGTAAAQSPVEWLSDFEAAKTKGLALELDLAGEPRVDRLIVLGLPSGNDEASSFAAILESHKNRGALGFVPTGVPTNNTDTESAYKPSEPGTTTDVHSKDDNAHVLARALGLKAETLDKPLVLSNTPHAQEAEGGGAAEMSRVLWPATWGYYLEQMMASLGGQRFPGNEKWAQEHFLKYVRADGPLPTLRIGKQPYGILPVASQAAWSASDADPRLLTLLRKLRATWLSLAENCPRVNAGSELFDILSLQAHSIRYDARVLLGRQYLRNVLAYLRWGGTGGTEPAAPYVTTPDESEFEAEFGGTVTNVSVVTRTFQVTCDSSYVTTDPARQDGWFTKKVAWLGGALNDALNDPLRYPWTPWPNCADGSGWPRIAGGVFTQDSFSLQKLPTVTEDDKNWLGDLHKAFLARSTAPDGLIHKQDNTSLLRLIIRHSTLCQIHGPSLDTEILVSDGGVRFREAFGPPVPPKKDPRNEELRASDSSFAGALEVLASLPSADLERLLCGTLDLSSYRLDAWITSLAQRRLMEGIRTTRPEGLSLGAYGWLEDLRPQSEATRSHGFVHAPSTSHAATAAILRSGYLAHARDKERAMASSVDLSSARVRKALWVLDSVRQGQPLGALLGYLFERGLAERGLPSDAFRELAPFHVAVVPPEGPPTQALVAESTDGLKLALNYRDAWVSAVGTPPEPVRQLREDIENQKVPPGALNELRDLWDLVDALGDLLLSETVYQAVLGRPGVAGGTLDALSRGELPSPELAVTRTPQSGFSFTHRLLLLFDGGQKYPPGWPPPRGRAARDLALNVFAGCILGPPDRVHFRADYLDARGDVLLSREFSLAELTSLCPLDVVCLAATSQTELTDQLVAHCRAATDVPEGSGLRLDLRRGDWPAARVSVMELLELAGSLARLLANGRPATVEDLAWTTERKTVPTEDLGGGVKAPLPHIPAPKATITDADGAVLQTVELAKLFPVAGQVIGSRRAHPWLQRVARVRPGARRLHDLLLYVEALNPAAEMDLLVGQYPLRDGATWMGLASDEKTLEGAGELSLVAWAPATLLSHGLRSVCGMVLDEWTELVPRAKTTTGLSFHYDQPDASPPQVLLLAVPSEGQVWNTDTLAEVVGEALDLAKIRAVAPEMLNQVTGAVGAAGARRHFLPALLFAHNTRGDTASTDFTSK